jgi:hypothetical protein
MRKPCATTYIEEKVNVRIDFLTDQDKQPEQARRKRRNFRLNGRIRLGRGRAAFWELANEGHGQLLMGLQDYW